MRSDRFKSGDLAWVTQRRNVWLNAMIPCRTGYPKMVNPKPGDTVTIIRRALASDFGIYVRHTYNGTSTARKWAMSSWLALSTFGAILIEEKFLCKRPYKPRRLKDG
jgi:hypothetical protein